MAEETSIVEPLVAPKKKHGNPTWFQYEGFTGRFQKIEEFRDLIPKFKDFYYEARLLNPNAPGGSLKIINDFNKVVAPLRFHPYPAQYRWWRKKWDEDIIQQLANVKKDEPVVKAIATRNAEGAILSPDEWELERGTKTLAGELVNDALTMLKADQERDYLQTDENLVKRRKYILDVMAHVTRLTQGKEALKIRKHAEGRETAGFLFDILRQAVAGKLTPDEMALLKSSFANENVPTPAN